MNEPHDGGCGCQWAEGPLGCDIRNHEWRAVWPVCAPRLECPACGYMNTNPECNRAHL
jgi:hypothetical protein